MSLRVTGSFVRQVVVVLLVWSLAVSSVHAQPSAAPGAVAVQAASKTWSEAQIVEMFGGGVTRSVSWGTVVGYAGTILVGAALVYAALDWFYQSASGSIGDDYLDCEFGPDCDTYILVSRITDVYGAVTHSYGISVKTYTGTAGSPTHYETAEAAYEAGKGIADASVNSAGYVVEPWEWLADCPMSTHVQHPGCWVRYGYIPLLQRIADGSPPSTELMNAVRDYVEANPLPSGGPSLYPGESWQSLEPTVPEWQDDPEADPNPDPQPEPDTDGDGIPDSQDPYPNDPTSTPDTDGDGIPDPDDPYPDDPTNAPENPEEEPGECAPLACESTLNQVEGHTDATAKNTGSIAGSAARTAAATESTAKSNADIDTNTNRTAVAAEAIEEDVDASRRMMKEIRDEVKRDRNVDYGPLSLLLPGWEPGDVTAAAWAPIKTQVQGAVNDLVATVSTKGPFALSGWVPIVSLAGGGSCESINMTILGSVQDVGICSTPVYTVLVTVVRSALLGLLIVSFWVSLAWAVAQT